MPRVTLISTGHLDKQQMLNDVRQLLPSLVVWLDGVEYFDFSCLSTHDSFFKVRERLLSQTEELTKEHLRSSQIVIVDKVLLYRLNALESDEAVGARGHATIALLMLAFPAITWLWLSGVVSPDTKEAEISDYHDLTRMMLGATAENWSALSVFDGSGLRMYLRLLMGSSEAVAQPGKTGIVVDDELDYLYFGGYALYRGGVRVLPIHRKLQADIILGSSDPLRLGSKANVVAVLEDLDLAFEDEEREETGILMDFAARAAAFPLLKKFSDQRLLWTIYSGKSATAGWPLTIPKVPLTLAGLQVRLAVPRIGTDSNYKDPSGHSIQGRLHWVAEALLDQSQLALSSTSKEPRRAVFAAVCALDAFRIAGFTSPQMADQSLETLFISEVSAEVMASNGNHVIRLESMMEEFSSRLWDCIKSSLKPKDAAVYLVRSQLALTERLLTLFRDANQFEPEWKVLSLQRIIGVKQRLLMATRLKLLLLIPTFPVLWFFYQMISSWPRLLVGLVTLFSLSLGSIVYLNRAVSTREEMRRIAEMWLSGQNINDPMTVIRFPTLFIGFVMIGITASFIYTRLSKK